MTYTGPFTHHGSGYPPTYASELQVLAQNRKRFLGFRHQQCSFLFHDNLLRPCFNVLYFSICTRQTQLDKIKIIFPIFVFPSLRPLFASLAFFLSAVAHCAKADAAKPLGESVLRLKSQPKRTHHRLSAAHYPMTPLLSASSAFRRHRS